MKRKLSICIYGGLICLLASCNNYLDVEPKGKIIPEKAEDYATIIHYWLDQIEKGTDDVIVPNPEKTGQLELFAEDLDATLATGYSTSYLYAGTSINNNQGLYEELYSVIKDCNIVIGDMEDKESELAKKLLGTAWAIRSICYYNLMQRYCEAYSPATAAQTLGLPLVDQFDMEAKPERSTLQETARFIDEGFKTALSYHQSDEDFLFTENVVKAYMARFYFWIQDWGNASEMAKEALEFYPMLEADEFADAINQKIRKTHNVIMRSFVEEDNLGNLSYTGAQADMRMRPVSRNMVELFNSSSNDVRRTVAFDAKRIVGKVVTTKFRSEELCLIIAESCAHSNDETGALKYLNLLRGKRITEGYVPYTSSTLPKVYEQRITVDATGAPLTKLMSAILCERRMELFLEGDRWFELKRNGCPEFWIAANGKKYVNEKYLYTFPLPKNDIELFPGLLIQNPGYIE